MIRGIGTSQGIAIGKVFKYDKQDFNIDITLKSNNSNEELKKLDESINKTINDINELKEKSLNNIGEEDAKIFDFHILMLEDQSYSDQIKELINEGYACSAATKIISDKVIDMFSQMASEYFKERIHDFKDVSNRLLHNIENVPLNNLNDINEEVIIVTNDLTPSDTATLNKKLIKGIVSENGSYTSHSAIISRSLDIPSIVGVENIMNLVDNDSIIIIDGTRGHVLINPSEDEIKEYTQRKEEILRDQELLKEYIDKPTVTTDNHSTHISLNIGHNDDLNKEVIFNSGVGLLRTELIYLEEKDGFPSEEKQFNIYKKILESFMPHDVVVRTIDIGGDKQLDYFKFDTENNPFLGYRAIRLCLDRKDIFKPQIRALLRASIYGNLCIMFPMIASVNEFLEAKQFVLDTKEELISEGYKVSDNFKIGAMIEVPSSTLMASTLSKYADFFSIGSNDLIQYTMAADRTLKDVAYLYQPLNPAVLKLIKMAIDGAHANGKVIGMCGEMSSNLEAIPLLVGLGLDDFSMFDTNVCKCKKLINSLNYEECKKLADKALQLETEEEVKELLKTIKGI